MVSSSIFKPSICSPAASPSSHGWARLSPTRDSRTVRPPGQPRVLPPLQVPDLSTSVKSSLPWEVTRSQVLGTRTCTSLSGGWGHSSGDHAVLPGFWGGQQHSDNTCQPNMAETSAIRTEWMRASPGCLTNRAYSIQFHVYRAPLRPRAADQEKRAVTPMWIKQGPVGLSHTGLPGSQHCESHQTVATQVLSSPGISPLGLT